MRIISKFQDYYDSALAYGFENDRVLVRHNQSWNGTDDGTPSVEAPSALLKKLQDLTKQVRSFEAFGASNRYDKRPRNNHMQITPLAFCVGGRVIKALWVLDLESIRLNTHSQYSYRPSGKTYRPSHNVPYLPELNPATQHATSGTFQVHPSEKMRQEGPVFSALEFEKITSPWTDYYKTVNGLSQDGHVEKIERLQQWLATPAPDLYVDAIANQMSIAVANPHGIAVNPCLKDWRFFKYWDAPTCMQELSMFVGNMSHPDNAPQIMDDKYRVQSHGFNEQSFRKQPTKHGLPKRAKRPHPDTPSTESTTDCDIAP